MEYKAQRKLKAKEVKAFLNELKKPALDALLSLLNAKSTKLIGTIGTVKFTEDPEFYEARAFQVSEGGTTVVVYHFTNFEYQQIVRLPS